METVQTTRDLPCPILKAAPGDVMSPRESLAHTTENFWEKRNTHPSTSVNVLYRGIFPLSSWTKSSEGKKRWWMNNVFRKFSAVVLITRRRREKETLTELLFFFRLLFSRAKSKKKILFRSGRENLWRRKSDGNDGDLYRLLR